MATLKYRLNRKNASGTYDTIHYETSSNIVMRPSGRTVEQDLADFLPRSQDTDDVPQSLTHAGISVGSTAAYCKLGNGTVRNLCQDTVYTHPTSKVCNYTYTHPTTKQCNYTPDLSNYATKSDLNSVSSPLVLLESYSGSANINALTNTNYAMFLMTFRFHTESSKGSIRITGEYGTIEILDNSAATNKSSFVYLLRNSCEPTWHILQISAFWLSYGGKNSTPYIKTAYMENSGSNYYLTLYVGSVSSFSAHIYGIA